MAATGFTPIQLYYSTTASAVPSAGNLAAGELAVNITDGKLFYKDNGGVVQVLATKDGASGDVVGPGSSTDNALVRFDGTTGKLVQSSVGILDDSGNLTGLAAVTMSGALTLNGGTANGVAYLNGSKVLTTGSALTFDGTNLGIGTSSPGEKLEVAGKLKITSPSADLILDATGTVANARWRILAQTGNTAKLFRISDDTAGADRLVIDASGNLGLGVTPSAWATSGRKVFQIGTGGAGVTHFAGGGGVNVLSNNTYFDGTSSIYINNGVAQQYIQSSSGHVWNTAPSGTAGNAISFTQAMTLDSSSNLLVGKTSFDYSIRGFQASPVGDVGNTQPGACFFANRTTTTGDAFIWFYGGVKVGSVSVTGSATSYNTSSDYRLKDNQQPLTGSGKFIDSLQPKTWSWKADGSKGVGFIAHEVQEVSPQSVVGEKDAVDEEGNPIMQAMEYGSAEFIANIVAELQSLRKRVAALEQA